MTEPSTDDVVLYELQDSIATITLNRPRYHNAQKPVARCECPARVPLIAEVCG
jgi:1,4-dihydroxy-2-naphthoyl-CoA synthase